MKTITKIHLLIISLINLILIGLMIRNVWHGNHNVIAIIWILYPIQTFVNATVWFILFIYQRSESKIYKWSTIGMIAAFIPTILIASMH